MGFLYWTVAKSQDAGHGMTSVVDDAARETAAKVDASVAEPDGDYAYELVEGLGDLG